MIVFIIAVTVNVWSSDHESESKEKIQKEKNKPSVKVKKKRVIYSRCEKLMKQKENSSSVSFKLDTVRKLLSENMMSILHLIWS